MPKILDREVGPIGYGLMGFTWRPEPAPVEQAIEAMKTALESGMNVWNGAEFYGTPEYNSMTLLKHYFTKYPEDADKVILVMKGGMDLATHKSDGSPEGIRRSMDNIISQLGGTKKVDLFSVSRRDPEVSLEVTFGALQREYIDTGKLGGVYLSECGPETIHEAAKCTKIWAAEVELSAFSPDILNNGVAAACAQYDIPILAYSPQGRGMLTGQFRKRDDMKHLSLLFNAFPRFQEENFNHNMKLVEQVEQVAKAKGCTPGQLAIAWVRKHNQRPGLPTVIPIPGATTASRVKENAKVVDISEDEFARINDIVQGFQTAGKRYPDFVPTNT